MKKILYMTDLSYKAKGRNYSEEDIYITDKLKNKYDVVLSHPKCAVSYEDYVDIVVFRNTGSVIGYIDIYSEFLKRVSEKKLKTFNSFDGKADMKGKQYLLELTDEKYPVIPTVDSVDDISILPKSDLYVIKPKDGADSIGLDFVTLEEINGHNICPGTMLIQPAIDEECDKADINPNMVDLTNVPNPHQGTIRYGKLSSKSLLRRIKEDFDSSSLPMAFEPRKTLAVTHINEYISDIVKEADYISGGDTRDSVEKREKHIAKKVDATYYLNYNMTKM